MFGAYQKLQLMNYWLNTTEPKEFCETFNKQAEKTRQHSRLKIYMGGYIRDYLKDNIEEQILFF